MNRLFLSLVMVLAGVLSASGEDRKDGVSASGKIGWHVVASADGADLLISEADQVESAAQKLCETPSVVNTKVVVAPDDSWIIVQSGGVSLGISFRAFKREAGTIYKEAPAEDITTAVLTSACGGDKAKAEAMDPVYGDLLAWAGDSKSVLVSVTARGGQRKIPDYFAVYHLGSGKVSFDLAEFNAAASDAPRR